MAQVQVDRRGAVATVTLDDPGSRNALTAASRPALRDALAGLADDPAVRAVVLTGAGSTFCVGQHLGEHAELLETGGARAAFATVSEDYGPIVTLLTGMPKPVVAAVNGTCVGAGLALALACDLRVFAETATLATSFTAIGLTCDSGLSASLLRSVGEARARRLVLLSETFSAADAVQWGVAGDVVPAEAVLDTALALAARLADGPTLAYAESKRLLGAAASGAGLPEVLALEAQAQERLGGTDDHRDAVASFLRRERPVFRGR